MQVSLCDIDWTVCCILSQWQVGVYVGTYTNHHHVHGITIRICSRSCTTSNTVEGAAGKGKWRVHHVKDVLSGRQWLSEEETSLHHNTQLTDLRHSAGILNVSSVWPLTLCSLFIRIAFVFRRTFLVVSLLALKSLHYVFLSWTSCRTHTEP